MRRVLAYLWASPWTLFGLLFAPFFARRQIREGVLVCEGASWPRRLGWHYSAVTFGHVVLSVTDATPSLMRHELAHVEQYERWGPFFVPAYLVAALRARLSGGSAHFDNRFEVQARNKSEVSGV